MQNMTWCQVTYFAKSPLNIYSHAAVFVSSRLCIFGGLSLSGYSPNEIFAIEMNETKGKE
jgi:hypothetical protein